MTIEEELSHLRQKYRDNDYRLSKHDTLLAREKLREFLSNGDNWLQAVEFVVDFPDDIGIQAYVDFYRGINFEKRMKLNQLLVENEKFQNNDNYRSVRRMVALLNKLLSFESREEEIYFLLRNMNRIILKEGKKGLSSERLEEILSVFNDSKQVEELEHELQKVRAKKKELEKNLEIREERMERLYKLISDFRDDYERLRDINQELANLLENRTAENR